MAFNVGQTIIVQGKNGFTPPLEGTIEEVAGSPIEYKIRWVNHVTAYRARHFLGPYRPLLASSFRAENNKEVETIFIAEDSILNDGLPLEITLVGSP